MAETQTLQSRGVPTNLEITNLAEILERILDKGIVVVGDIKVCIADVELLTIKIRLMIASVDKAKEMGINWWESDSYLASSDVERLAKENFELRRKLKESQGK